MYPDKLTDRVATLLLYASPSLLFFVPKVEVWVGLMKNLSTKTLLISYYLGLALMTRKGSESTNSGIFTKNNNYYSINNLLIDNLINRPIATALIVHFIPINDVIFVDVW